MTWGLPFTVMREQVQKANLRVASVGRSNFHATLPEARLRAMTNGFSRPSQEKMRLLAAMMGVAPLPCWGLYLMERFSQSLLPSRSRQAVPWWPKWT